MKRTAITLALLTASTLGACTGGDECPPNSIERNGVCIPVANDSGVADTGIGDTGTDVDTGVVDTGQPVDTGVATANLDTPTLDFGRIIVGTTSVMSLRISNTGTAEAPISIGAISGSTAFAFTSSVTADSIGPGSVLTFEVTYAPTEVGSANATIDIELCDAGCSASVSLLGVSLAEAITCSPSSINFGFVNPGACAKRPITCDNASSLAASVDSAELTSDASDAFAISLAGALPVSIPGGGSTTIDVDYCPTDFVNDSGAVVVQVEHPDPAQRTQAIALSGIGGGPDIDCQTTLDLGTVAIGQSSAASVQCENRGNVSLLVTAAGLRAGASLEFAFNSDALPITLDAGLTTTFDVVFSPTAAGTHTVFVDVDSNDVDTPTATIEISAESIDTAGCTLVLSPAAIDFGSIPLAASRSVSLQMSNTGTDPCLINSLDLAAATDVEFTLGSLDGAALIGVGEARQSAITFSAQNAGTYSGAVEIDASDLANPLSTVALSASALAADQIITADPPALDFGTSRVGCSLSGVELIVVRNPTAQDQTITASFEPGTSPAFAISGNATATAPAGGTATFVVEFAPQTTGAHLGRLRLTTGVQTIFVELSGDADNSGANTDTFSADTARKIDILLVIDESGSMFEEIVRVGQAISQLLAAGDQAGAQYHIGVIGMDPLTFGQLRGPTTVVPWTNPNRVAEVQANLPQQTGSFAVEEGLRAMTEATTNLTLVNGANAGFLRADASLVVIIVSDEEDQSPGTPNDYLQTLANRPVGAPNGFSIFTLSGGLNGCLTADASTRYPFVADASAGFDRSVCDQDYSTFFQDVGAAIFGGLPATFPLSATPEPSSVSVVVDGTLTPASTGTVVNWGVSYAESRVTFLPGRLPAGSSTVAVSYTTLCVSTTCGDGTPDATEQCDDGNQSNTDACLNICYDAFCGDSAVRANVEQCDDGNTIPGDGCNATCTIEGCGNGIPEPGEACDDGTANSDVKADACRTDCTLARCNDGVVDTGEGCDDGNENNNDACVGECFVAVCGDGFVEQGVEQCDDGNQNNNDQCDNLCNFTASGYTISSSGNSPLTPTVGGAAMTFTSNDDGFATVAIGFPFEFAGVAVTEAYPTSNGLIAFDNTSAGSRFNVAIPNATAPDAFIAWWWDDLFLTRFGFTTSAETSLLGAAPNRVRVFTFIDVPHYSSGGDILTAEVRLFETSNVIEVHYGQRTATGAATFFSATTGFESFAGVIGADALGCGAVCVATDWPTDSVLTYTP